MIPLSSTGSRTRAVIRSTGLAKKQKKANAPNFHVRLANQRNALKYAHTITN
jgi:hypothetical protein